MIDQPFDTVRLVRARSNSRSIHTVCIGIIFLIAACSEVPSVQQQEIDDEISVTTSYLGHSIPSGPYTPGSTYYSSNDYIEYIAGNLPIIVSAPHGGHLTPSGMPDRTEGACNDPGFHTGTDTNTAQLARAIRTAFYNHTGKYPHVIINRLHRVKLDANRSKARGACGYNTANMAWEDFHGFIEVAKNQVLDDYGRGWYTDLHGQSHPIARIELGYRLTSSDLRESDAILNSDSQYQTKSSYRTFAEQSTFNFASALLRGNKAIGTLLENEGYPSVPSKQDPAPNVGDPFFSGGYNTGAHGCNSGGDICGVQIEANYTGIRDNSSNRAAFAQALVRSYETFLGHNFGISLWSTKGEVVIDNYNGHNDPEVAYFEASENWGGYSNNSTKYLSSFRRAEGAGPNNDGANFFFYVPEPGSYSVYAWWPEATSRSTSVRYRVFEEEFGTMFYDDNQNQQINGGQWNLLGTWTWTKSGWGKVLISRSLSGSGTIAADGVRVVQH